MSALSYTNRRGDRYYLHAGRTRTGKQRYFVAKTSGEKTLAKLAGQFIGTIGTDAFFDLM